MSVRGTKQTERQRLHTGIPWRPHRNPPMDPILDLPRAGTMLLVCRIPELAGGRTYRTDDLLLIDDKRVESDAETYAGTLVGPGADRTTVTNSRVERYDRAIRIRPSIPKVRPISKPAEATVDDTTE